jgi:hypothetical protein
MFQLQKSYSYSDTDGELIPEAGMLCVESTHNKSTSKHYPTTVFATQYPGVFIYKMHFDCAQCSTSALKEG